jgi:sec-independent protein translocase protein TatA
MGISFWHILVVVLVIMLLFGTKRLPGTMEDLAKGLKAFKKGLKDDDEAPKKVEADKPAKD